MANNAVTLDGSTQYGKVLNYAALDGLTNFTLEGWFKQNATGGNTYAKAFQLTNSSEELARLTTENASPSTGTNFGVGYSGTDADGYKSSSVFDTGTWVHVALVSTVNNKTKIYKNGVEISYDLQQTPTGSIVSHTDDDLWIGVSKDLNKHFKGDVGCFRVWNVSRTTAQIAENMNYYLDPTQETGLILNCNVDEESGTTIDNDVSGGNDCSLTGSPSWTTGPTLFPKNYDVEFAYLQNATDTTDTTTYTFSSQNIGAADTDRKIIVAIHSRKAGAVSSISSVTVGGVSATQVVENWNSAGTNSDVSALYIASVPTGTTGNIVVTFAATMLRCAIAVYRAVGISTTAYDTDSSDAGDPSVTLDVPIGIAIGAVTTNATTSVSWTGITEKYDTTLETFVTLSGGYIELGTLETGRTITGDFASPGSESAGVFASWAWITPVSDYRNARTKGKTTTSSTRNARIKGKATDSSTRNAIVVGATTAESSARNARIVSKDTTTSIRNARIKGKVTDTSARNARIEGQVTTSSARNARLVGKYGSGVAQSLVVDVGSDYITKAILWCSYTLNGGSLTFYMSADGGNTFEEVTPNTDHTFTIAGPQLVYKIAIEPNGDGTQTPSIDWLRITYNDEPGVGITSARNARLKGKETVSSTRNARIEGQVTVSDTRSARTKGVQTLTDSRNARIKGKVTATNNRSARIIGAESASGTRNARIVSKDTASSIRNARIKGVETLSSTRGARTEGSVTVSSARNARLKGVQTLTSARNARIEGQVTVSDTRNARIEGQVTVSSNRNARTKGVETLTSTRNARIKGKVTTSDTRNARIKGIAGASATRNARTKGKVTDSSTRNARIEGQVTTSNARNARLKGKVTASSNRNARIKGKVTDTSIRNARLKGVETVSSIRGARTEGSVTVSSNRNARIVSKQTLSSSRSARIDARQQIRDNRNARIIGKTSTSSTRGAHMVGKDWQVENPQDWYIPDPQSFSSDATGDWYDPDPQPFVNDASGDWYDKY